MLNFRNALAVAFALAMSVGLVAQAGQRPIAIDDIQHLVDVRDPQEVAASGKVKGALNVSRGMLEFRADPDSPYHDKAFDRSKPVLVYCASGGRSALAGKTLKELGYGTVLNAGAEWHRAARVSGSTVAMFIDASVPGADVYGGVIALAPGAVIPAHWHSIGELQFVLSGTGVTVDRSGVRSPTSLHTAIPSAAEMIRCVTRICHGSACAHSRAARLVTLPIAA